MKLSQTNYSLLNCQTFHTQSTSRSQSPLLSYSQIIFPSLFTNIIITTFTEKVFCLNINTKVIHPVLINTPRFIHFQLIGKGRAHQYKGIALLHAFLLIPPLDAPFIRLIWKYGFTSCVLNPSIWPWKMSKFHSLKSNSKNVKSKKEKRKKNAPEGLKLARFRRGLSEGRLLGKRVSVKLWKWFKKGRNNWGGLQEDGKEVWNGTVKGPVEICDVTFLDDESERGRKMLLSAPTPNLISLSTN